MYPKIDRVNPAPPPFRSYNSDRNDSYRSRDGGSDNRSSFYNHRSSYGNDNKERQRDSDRDRSYGSRPSSNFSSGSGYNNFNSGSNFSNGRDKSAIAGGSLPKIDWSQMQLSTFQKNFYTELDTVKNKPQKEIDDFRNEHQIIIRSTYAPRPIFSFEEANFPPYILEQLTSKFKTPSPIQSQGWPAALSGLDVIGIAQTGSGKTISFLLPGFVHINAQEPLKMGDGPIMVVLAPTRELAVQIQDECQKFARNAKIYSTAVYGGTDKWGQKREIQRGNHIIVATPGRLLDFLEMGVINLRRVTYLVLDEADRMLDMGFEPQIRRIISQIRPDRQTLMWSATWPREVQKLALEFCKEKPVHVVIGNNDLAVNLRIKQNVEVIDNVMKQYRIGKVLEEIKNSGEGGKTLIFTQTKRGADGLVNQLAGEGYHAVSLHGDKTQGQRDYIMRLFKTGRTNILIATDLAARGLDVADIKFVVNYDFPGQLEDYIHRVGRTGRAGKEGCSYTFFTREDWKHAYKFIDILEETRQKVPDDLYKIARRPIPKAGYVPQPRKYEPEVIVKPTHTRLDG
jgi:ATP-dependent RNA helicase DDX5/DBP2